MSAVSGLKVVQLGEEKMQALLARVKTQVDPRDYEAIEGLAAMVQALVQAIQDKDTSVSKLRRVLFGVSTEKTKTLFKESQDNVIPSGSKENAVGESPPKDQVRPKRKGHGRNGADDYPGAERIPIAHPSLSQGCLCPHCQKGKVYRQEDSGKETRFKGSVFIIAKIYEPEKWRCNLCLKVFTAPLPPDAGDEKYDETAASMIALLRYGSGLPFHRIEKLQESLGVPLPASTQWEIAEEAAGEVAPAFGALVDQAAQGEVIYNDDTPMTVLSLKKNEESPATPAPPSQGPASEASNTAAAPDGGPEVSPAPGPERTGVFTSGIVATSREGHPIALYFTGRKHAGERLTEVLQHRNDQAGPPIQMCDGLSRNLSKTFLTILSNCLSHARRNFVDIVRSFPAPCRHVLESLSNVYHNDDLARERALSPQERLAFHQAESEPIMNELHDWMDAQLQEKKIEPNSGLGKAIAYMLKRWLPLTLFLRQPGAPLDNNICERALKMAILHRKNSLFYKTENGAWVGDVFMSLIQTCRLCGANPFDYLTVLQKNADRVRDHPRNWLPWNYRDALKSFPTPKTPTLQPTPPPNTSLSACRHAQAG